jgi:hypothetical protein
MAVTTKTTIEFLYPNNVRVTEVVPVDAGDVKTEVDTAGIKALDKVPVFQQHLQRKPVAFRFWSNTITETVSIFHISPPHDQSGIYYIDGVVCTKATMERSFPGETKIIAAMEKQPDTKIVRSFTGDFFILSSEDRVIAADEDESSFDNGEENTD